MARKTSTMPTLFKRSNHGCYYFRRVVGSKRTTINTNTTDYTAAKQFLRKYLQGESATALAVTLKQQSVNFTIELFGRKSIRQLDFNTGVIALRRIFTFGRNFFAVRGIQFKHNKNLSIICFFDYNYYITLKPFYGRSVRQFSCNTGELYGMASFCEK